MRATDPRGASRRGNDNTDLGYANIDGTGARARMPHHVKPAVIPDHGCHMYQVGNLPVLTRCLAHRPMGSIDKGPVNGECIECYYEKVRGKL